MKFLLPLFILSFSVAAHAQYGVLVKWNQNNYDELLNRIELGDQNIFTTTYEIGVDYWFRLKNYRMEFYPEFTFEKAAPTRIIETGEELSFHSFRFYFRTHFYVFDFYEDCDCPTFSKQGNSFTRGFHLILAPGVGLYSFGSENREGQTGLSALLAGGVGWDAGITDMITLTPFVLYRRTFPMKWESFTNGEEGFNSSSIMAGLRLGFRFDYKSTRKFR